MYEAPPLFPSCSVSRYTAPAYQRLKRSHPGIHSLPLYSATSALVPHFVTGYEPSISLRNKQLTTTRQHCIRLIIRYMVAAGTSLTEEHPPQAERRKDIPVEDSGQQGRSADLRQPTTVELYATLEELPSPTACSNKCPIRYSSRARSTPINPTEDRSS